MILQALYELHRRQCADPEDAEFAPPGCEWREIPFVLVVDRRGRLVAIEDTRTKDARNRLRAGPFMVPAAVKRSANIAANLLWDNPAYALGFDPEAAPSRVRRQHEAFLERIGRLGDAAADEGVGAVLAFLRDDPVRQAERHPCWPEVAGAVANTIAFRLDGDARDGKPRLVCERPAVVAMLAQDADADGEDAPMMQCLITGRRGPVARLHPIINGVFGTQQNRGNIVSFNFGAAESHGRQQGANAPVSTEAAEGYARALNRLLARDSKQKMGIGDTTVVFWARRPHALEDVMTLWLADEASDDPGARAEAVRSLYGSPWKGRPADYGEETPFYVLGLAPNAARISIRFWLETTIHAMSENIRRYFDEIALVARDDAPPPALRRLLSALAVQRKLENLPPKLEGAVVHSILQGTPYPRALLQLAVLRSRAEQGVMPSRAALLKAYLIRNCKENYAMSLDERDVSPAYLLGRLFSVLERIQEQASPGLNTTIRDRYYGAACSRPAGIFPLLLRLKNHHNAKLKGEKPGLAVNLEKLTGQIMNGLAKDLPACLSLEDQGRFALGYYHQRQSFFTKKESAPDAEVA